MTMTDFARRLQGRDFKVIMGDDVARNDAMFEMLANRAASMVQSACGMRSGSAHSVDGRALYYIYSWDLTDGGGLPVFFVTHEHAEYQRIRGKFLEGEIKAI